MKRIFKQKFELTAIVIALFLVGCGSDDTAVFETDPDGGLTPPATEDATLIFNEADSSLNKVIATASGEAGSTVPGRVVFSTTGKTQRRMYITQNISGQGDMPFNEFDLTSEDLKKALKADGSIDLDSATKMEIDFTFNLPVPAIDNGSIVYSFWTTTGKGDFRKPSKRLKLGVGTITVTVGTGANPAAAVREYNGITLKAPLGNGESNTFISLLDNSRIYKINEGPEFVALWDFGYYYGFTQNASFASINNYPFNIFDLVKVANENKSGDEPLITNEDLNMAYFALSTKTSGDFDSVSVSGDLDDITQPTSQRVTNLIEGNIVEFVDFYGNKGLIRVNNIVAGDGNAGAITIDIKVQPYIMN